LGSGSLDYMIKNHYTRQLESTQDWIAAQSTYRDRYLLENSDPTKAISNLLKLEIGIRDA
jgi:hypothetical protein